MKAEACFAFLCKKLETKLRTMLSTLMNQMFGIRGIVMLILVV